MKVYKILLLVLPLMILLGAIAYQNQITLLVGLVIGAIALFANTKKPLEFAIEVPAVASFITMVLAVILFYV